MARILVTGGAGFIGGNLVRHLVARGHEVWNLDRLTYAGCRESIDDLADHPRHHFVKGDIADAATVERCYLDAMPDAVFNLAAESHVDRSIDGPHEFVRTNVTGAHELLAASLAHWRRRGGAEGPRFLHVQVSTDEVFGSIDEGEFTEQSRYAPNSPYAATKAAADHLARAYFQTYGLPVIVTNCSNNYGPYQFPEKLIPLMISKALRAEPLPVYGDGGQVRDWLHVQDHVDALDAVLERGKAGESYLVGGGTERTNLELVHALCAVLDEIRPRAGGASYAELIAFVKDRPGHDRRYAVDGSRTEARLGWKPRYTLAAGLRETIAWYLGAEGWLSAVRSRGYSGERLGAGASAVAQISTRERSSSN